MQYWFKRSARRRKRLIVKYFFTSLLLIASGLVVSGAVEVYYRYRESHEHFAQLQQEIARTAAIKIESFINAIVDTAIVATKSRDIAEKGLTEEFNYELKRLLFTVSAITEATAYDRNRTIRAQVSRLPVGLYRKGGKNSVSGPFERAVSGHAYTSPVYFFKGSEPYMTVALPMEQYPGNVVGALVVEVNLKHVVDTISSIKVGKAGYAYVVTRSGELIAHRDIDLVLQHRNLSNLSQVQNAYAPATIGVTKPLMSVNKSLEGLDVISSSTIIPRRDWAVIVERSANEAYAYIYGSLVRTSGILL